MDGTISTEFGKRKKASRKKPPRKRLLYVHDNRIPCIKNVSDDGRRSLWVILWIYLMECAETTLAPLTAVETTTLATFKRHVREWIRSSTPRLPHGHARSD